MLWAWIACSPPDAPPVGVDDPPAETSTESDPPVVEETDDSDVPVVVGPVQLSGGFVDISAALWAAGSWSVDEGSVSPFREINYTHGLFVDLDGVGGPEVLVMGLRASPELAPQTLVLRYAGASLSQAPALTARFSRPAHSVSAMVDFDGDGDLDVVVGDGQGEVVFGPVGTFREQGASPGFVNAGLADLDRDGWLDVLIGGLACQPGTPTWTPLMRTGSRRFTAKPESVLTPGVEVGRLFSVGWLPARDLVVAPGNTCPGTTGRPVAWRRVEADGAVTWVGEEPAPLDAPYRVDTGGDTITALHPASATAFDVDGDGDLDLAMGSYLSRIVQWRDDGGPLFTDVTDAHPIPVLPREGVGPTSDLMIPWGIAALDFDRDGLDDLLINHGDDVGAWASGVPGTQRPVLWLRRGDGWQEGLAGLPAVFEGRSLTVGDLDRDGRPDLVLGGIGELPRVLLNRIEGPAGVALRLVGTTSNPLGIGAVVRPVEGGQEGPARAVGHLVGPGPMSEGLVFLAAGADGDLDTARIVWPSGLVQEVGPLAGGQVHEVVEPVTWAVEPASRQAPADGVSTVRLVITPRRVDGSVDEGAAVSVRVVAGPGRLVGAPTWTGSAWEQALRAPASPGELVLEVTVNGAAWPLRPRVWWD
jgi:hypothetical protein